MICILAARNMKRLLGSEFARRTVIGINIQPRCLSHQDQRDFCSLLRIGYVAEKGGRSDIIFRFLFSNYVFFFRSN